jgi:hypothetical protein
MRSSDGRDPSLKALDAEANQRFGPEANRLFGGGTYTHTLYGPRADHIKRQAAKAEIDKCRAYSGYLTAGAALLTTYFSSDYGMPTCFVIGAMTALATHFSLPPALDKLEDFLTTQVEVKEQVTHKVKVKAYYA